MILSPSDLELVRTVPQSSTLYLSIFTPNVVMSCQPTGTLARGDRTIPFMGVTTGSYTGIESGMTLLVGTSPGSDDLGKIRIKSATVSEITVAENSHINWAQATHLTVLRYWELWPIYPKIISDPLDSENVIFYKDYDIPYTDQNSILGAFPCAGTHRAGFSGDSFYYSTSGTSHLLGSALSYSWSFEGGSITGSTSATPGYVRYDNPGSYVTRLVVTGANGSVDTTYRYVSIYERPGSSTDNLPIRKWEMDELSGSRAEGGYTTTVRVIDEILPTIRDGDVVVIWADDWYGSQNVSLGGNSENNSSIFFVGHISNGSIRYNYQTSVTEFQVASITDIMKLSEGFSVSVESKDSPSKWFELLDMDGRRAIYHYLKWHTTALYFNDFQFLGTDQKIQFFDSDRGSMFDAVDNYMRGTLVGSVVADRQNKIWAEVDAKAYTNPTGSFPPIQNFSKRDWIGEPSIQRAMTAPISYLEMGGVAYSGTTTGTFSALIGVAPGETPSTRGRVERVQGLALSSQSQLNQLVGNVFANKNTKYPIISVEARGNYAHLDIAPQTTLGMQIEPNDNNAGIRIQSPYLIDSMSWTYSNNTKLVRLDLGALVTGEMGETITIPDVPDGGGYSEFGGSFGGFNPGAFPPFLTSFSNKPVGSWGGTYSNETTLNTGFSISTTIFNYGFISPGRAPVAGVYLVTVILKGDAVSGCNFRMWGYTSPLDHTIGVAPGDVASYSNLVLATEVNQDLRPYTVANLVPQSGNFNLSIALLYQL